MLPHDATPSRSSGCCWPGPPPHFIGRPGGLSVGPAPKTPSPLCEAAHYCWIECRRRGHPQPKCQSWNKHKDHSMLCLGALADASGLDTHQNRNDSGVQDLQNASHKKRAETAPEHTPPHTARRQMRRRRGSGSDIVCRRQCAFGYLLSSGASRRTPQPTAVADPTTATRGLVPAGGHAATRPRKDKQKGASFSRRPPAKAKTGR